MGVRAQSIAVEAFGVLAVRAAMVVSHLVGTDASRAVTVVTGMKLFCHLPPCLMSDPFHFPRVCLLLCPCLCIVPNKDGLALFFGRKELGLFCF